MKPVAELTERHGGSTRRVAILFGWLFVGAISASYEIFEWLLTIIASPATADEYNGQQGDIWDSQKDMAIAIVGATLVTTWLLAINCERD